MPHIMDLKELKKVDPEFYAAIISSKISLDSKKLIQKLKLDQEQEDEADYESDQKDVPVQVKNVLNRRKAEIKSSKLKYLSDSEDTDEEDDVNSSASSDDEENDEVSLGSRTDQPVLVTEALVKQWEKELQGESPQNAFTNVSSSLLAAILSVTSKDSTIECSRFVVKTPAIYNQLVHVSLQHMAPALHKMLGIKTLAHIPSSRKFKRYELVIMSYCDNLLKLYDTCTKPPLRALVLQHGLRPLIAVYKSKTLECREFLQKMVTAWATEEKQIKIHAFFCIYGIIKIVIYLEVFDYTVKMMYEQFVYNVRCTRPDTRSDIEFMVQSLSEILSMEDMNTYKHGYGYVQQLVTAVKDAALDKKEKLQLVYCWPFVHCTDLWCKVLSTTYPNKVLEPLIYPVVQVALNATKLDERPRYFPLLLHLCRILTDLGKVDVFIPVLPVLLRIFSEIKTPKGSKDCPNASVPSLECCITLTDSQLQQREVMRVLMRSCSLHIVRYLATHAHNIAFPELSLPAVKLLKRCAKRPEQPCPGQARQLLTHITEHADYIETRRRDVEFQVKDKKQIDDWERETKQVSNLPIVKYYEKLMQSSEQQNAGQLAASKLGERPYRPSAARKQKKKRGAKKMKTTNQAKR